MMTFIFMMLIISAIFVCQEDDDLSFNEVYIGLKGTSRKTGGGGGGFTWGWRSINRKICKYHITVSPFQYCSRRNVCRVFNISQKVKTCTT